MIKNYIAEQLIDEKNLEGAESIFEFKNKNQKKRSQSMTQKN